MKQVKVEVSGMAMSGKTSVLLVIQRALAQAGFKTNISLGLATEDSRTSRIQRLENIRQIAEQVEVTLTETQLKRTAA